MANIECIKKWKASVPVGVSDYRLASTEYYYIDRTLGGNKDEDNSYRYS